MSDYDDITVENVDDKIGQLTADQAEEVFRAYDSPLKDQGNGLKLIEAFNKAKVSPWTGLAIIKQESSFANRNNNKSLDERNEANPFSVHFTDPSKWKDCKKNALLISDSKGEYKSTIAGCSAKGSRLPTFAESAELSAKSARNLKTYREEGGYEKELNGQLRDILRKIKAKRKAQDKTDQKTKQ